METFQEAQKRREAEQKALELEVENLIANETHCDEEVGIKRLEERFFRNFGCINFCDDAYMHEVHLARIFHKWHKDNWPEKHDEHEEEPYRCYHETVCKCGYREACDSSD